MKKLTKFRLFLWYFSRFKVRLIGYVSPKLLQLDDNQVLIKIPFKKRTKNHLNSMYFGALAIGADLAAGMHGYYYAAQYKTHISLAFKNVNGTFIKRPEKDVFFHSAMGAQIDDLIKKSIQMQQRVNEPIEVKAYVNYFSDKQMVAEFTLMLSIKVKTD